MIYISRIFVAVVLYMFVVLMALAFKPALMFDAAGRAKQFGVGMDQGYSVFAPAFLFPLSAFLCYVVSALITVVMV